MAGVMPAGTACLVPAVAASRGMLWRPGVQLLTAQLGKVNQGNKACLMQSDNPPVGCWLLEQLKFSQTWHHTICVQWRSRCGRFAPKPYAGLHGP
jgi:hypothetical protein